MCSNIMEYSMQCQNLIDLTEGLKKKCYAFPYIFGKRLMHYKSPEQHLQSCFVHGISFRLRNLFVLLKAPTVKVMRSSSQTTNL